MSDVAILRGDIGGPPLQLPTFGDERPRIRITPGTSAKTAKPDPWAGWTDEGPNSDAAPVQQGAAPSIQPGRAVDPWAGWTDEGPNSDINQPAPQIGLGEAALMGARSGLTAGFYPWLKGAWAGGSAPGSEFLPYQSEEEATKTLAGQQKAATKAREEQLKYEEAAAAQHPLGYYGSELAAGVAPALLSGGATTAADAGLATQMGRAALGGMGYGGLSGAGGALSEGTSPQGVAGRAALGAGVGAGLGAVGGAVGEGLLRGGQYVGRIARGARDPNTEAGRQVVQRLQADVDRFGYPVTPAMGQTAQDVGLPLGIVDLGSQGTRDLARIAATSSDAWQTFQDFFGRRAGAGERIGGFVRRITGGARAADDRDVLEARRAAENNAAYRAAYTAGDRQIRSPEIDTLLSSPEVVDAVRTAVRKGQNYAVDEGHGAFNPGVNVTNDGRIVFNRGQTGVPAYPNIQFWDYVQRSLRSASDKYARAGDRDSARVTGNLRDRLNAELDNLVPEFGVARQGAAAHFRARDAHAAGESFVGSNMDYREATRHIRNMTPSERELFARGFASELANRFERLRYDLRTINQTFVDSPQARNQIRAALGGTRSAQLEALLRAEALAQQSGRILGGSPTMRNLAQYAGHGIGGAGAVAGVEALEHEDLNPKALLVGALMGGALRGYARHVDARIATRIAEMLTSDDPTVLAAGARSLVRNREMFNNLRASTRTAAITPAMFGARHPVGTTAAGSAYLHEGEGEGTAGTENDPYFGTYYGTEKRQ